MYAIRLFLKRINGIIISKKKTYLDVHVKKNNDFFQFKYLQTEAFSLEASNPLKSYSSSAETRS